MATNRDTTLTAIMWLGLIIGWFFIFSFSDSINPFTPESLPGRYFFWLLVTCLILSVAMMCWITHYYTQRVLYKAALRIDKICDAVHSLTPEIAPALDTDFEMLNRSYYTRVTREFVAVGFRELGDFRDESIHPLSKSIYGAYRIFLDDSGEILAVCTSRYR